MPPVLARTSQGTLEGRDRGGILRFTGISYAAPPIGPRRFGAPEPPEPWKGVRDARSFGPTAWQSTASLSAMVASGSQNHDEDCLTLNVFTPACDEDRRPVMVWIHGGGFASGSGSIPWYDGTSFVRRGDVVVVTINYRLGALGFMDLSGIGGSRFSTSGINGILDQIAALRWVRENISAFGGDPGCVTVFGESAGAMSIATLLAMPAAEGLFANAILQSGGVNNTLTTDQARRVTDTMLMELALTDIDGLEDVSPQQLITAQDAVLAKTIADPTWLRAEGFSLAMPFQPVCDGTFLPYAPIDAIREGSARDVRIIAGTNLNEWNLFDLAREGALDEPRLLARLGRHFAGDGRGTAQDSAQRARSISDRYRASRPDASEDEIWRAVMTDVMFRIPTIELLEAQAPYQPSSTFAYLFSWASTAFEGRLGACHALELPFVWNNTGRPGTELLLGADEVPAGLAEAMHDAWWHFAASGDPNHPGIPTWPAYDTTGRATLEFSSRSAVSSDPGAAERALWAPS